MKDVPVVRDNQIQGKEKPTKQRWFMLLLICFVIAVNYLDRGNLAVAAPVMQHELNLPPATMGILFSAFAWSYSMCLPVAGILLDKLGPRLLMTIALVGWSAATFAMGLFVKFWQLVLVRLGLGVFESPIIPTNVRCVASWFPDRERAFAVGAYTATEYVALGVLTPVLSWILITWGWEMIFFLTGLLGLAVGVIWHYFYRSPADNKNLNDAERQYMKAGGALMGGEVMAKEERQALDKSHHLTQKQVTMRLLKDRRLVGMYVGHFSIMTTLFFFLTWFPSYLVTEKGLTILKSGFYAMVPFLVAIIGSLIGGKWSDWLYDKGYSKTIARKLPIILGFLLSTVIVGANYVNSISLIISLMAVAFFGQAMASAVTGALLSDISPAGSLGTSGGLLNFFANLGSATCPLIIGVIVQEFGTFEFALVYVGAIALLGLLAYTVILKKVERIQL